MFNFLDIIYTRLASAWYCLIGVAIPVPYKSYKVMCISEETIIMSATESPQSLETALWALERPNHYWRSTDLGCTIRDEVNRTMDTDG